MMDINQILVDAGIETALIVDDSYDDAPLATDLTLELDAWTPFFQDINDEDENLIRDAYPDYDSVDSQELISRDDFIRVLWRIRGNISADIINPIFETYHLERQAELSRLGELEALLVSYGLTVSKSGRDFVEQGSTAHLIVIDLFLGRSQSQTDANISINGLKTIISNRASAPPLVMLMSNNNQLLVKQIEFKTKTGLFEFAFRFIKKADLVTDFQILLMRLARHYRTSLLLIGFVNNWEFSLNNSTKEVTALIKKLDLVDIAYIKKLLLDKEGESTGAYLVDIFDKALQYSIEGQDQLITAARALNDFSSDNYPPPYLPVSPDLHALVYQTHFQNLKRSTIHVGAEHKLGLGDFFKVASGGRQHPSLFELNERNVLVALNPACDLARPGKGTENILFMVGELLPFTQDDWMTWSDAEIRTTVIEIENTKYWIRWSQKNIRTISWSIFNRLIAKTKIKFIARARESHALELQQKLLSNLGRVGLLAPLPATFPTKIKIYLPDLDGKLFHLSVPELADAGGTCYIDKGKKESSNIHLVICETSCEAILRALTILDINTIHANSRAAVSYLLTTPELRMIGNGIKLNVNKKNNQKIQSNIDPTKSIGVIVRTVDESTKLSRNELFYAGIVIHVP
ncbi:hypothetical protein [Methylophilus sp. YYY-1]|uniref:hypothetical protein n=1 Tax=Methylophilus sp. YYY-1 TaxID=2682087 RepID=UPI0023B2D0F8|nr:hypothetical protein [Methylophilus sp. YYY-1]MDF0379005.1 hypothetical protein [Methylophilus sp. YYY-1]